MKQDGLILGHAFQDGHLNVGRRQHVDDRIARHPRHVREHREGQRQDGKRQRREQTQEGLIGSYHREVRAASAAALRRRRPRAPRRRTRGQISGTACRLEIERSNTEPAFIAEMRPRITASGTVMTAGNRGQSARCSTSGRPSAPRFRAHCQGRSPDPLSEDLATSPSSVRRQGDRGLASLSSQQ